MPIYRIAELNIKIEPQYSKTLDTLAPYLTDGDEYDFAVPVDPEGLEAFTAASEFPGRPGLNEGVFFYTYICKKILNDFDGFFFHSSCLALDGEGYVFTALSGTGKSTHTRNWRKCFGDRVVMINDDKPIIRKINGTFYVCGTPWMGKSDIGCNMIAPVKAVFVLQRGEQNSARRVNPGTVLKQLMEATLLPSERTAMQKQLSLFDELFRSVGLYLLTCNQDVESASVAYNAVVSG